MPVLSNPREERFCQFRAEGMSADEAYVAAGYKKHRGNASRMSANENIIARIAEIQGEAAARVVMELAEGLQFCSDIIRAAVGNLDQFSPLVQEYTRDVIGSEDEGQITRIKIKVPNKLDALDKLAKFKGWYATEKLQVDAADPLLAVLARARQRK